MKSFIAARFRLLQAYAAVLSEEPRLRAYLLGSIIDDIGVAASVWAIQIMFVNLFTDQEQRARFMIPNLISFLLGSLIAGPLADWARGSLPRLLRWRWRVFVWARLLETAALGLAIWAVSGGAPTLAMILPYSLIRSFMKTGFSATRQAFEIDLLAREEVQRDAQGNILLDERGQPLMYKLHLLSVTGLLSGISAAATLGGLLLGGKILKATGGSYVPVLAFDVLTNLAVIACVYWGCHPNRAASAARLSDLLGERANPDPIGVASQGRSLLAAAMRELYASMREAVQFLRQPAQRPLLCLLAGRWMIEIMNEVYDGKMMIKHVLHGSDDAVRHAEILWSVVEIGALLCLPALTRSIGSLGKLFLGAMLLDGVVMAAAGRISALGATSAIAPFMGILAADRALTLGASTLAILAQSSASSTALRGRLAALYVFVVILSDLLAQLGATALTRSYGIPGTLFRVGIAQIMLVCVVGALGGRALWSFGLRSTPVSRS